MSAHVSVVQVAQGNLSRPSQRNHGETPWLR